jgi:hypothetical protein
MQTEVYLKLCHISGYQMIATGIDGWSRGNFDAGISLDYYLRDYLPLAVSAFDIAAGSLRPWLKWRMGSHYSEPLTPEGWL